MASNKEAVETAQAFQSIINEMVPETERLVAIEYEYKELVRDLIFRGVAEDLLPPREDFDVWLKTRHEKRMKEIEDDSKVRALQQPSEPETDGTDIQKR